MSSLFEKKLRCSLHLPESLKMLDLLNYDCIFYGFPLILLNNNINPEKYKILCNSRKLKKIRDFFINNKYVITQINYKNGFCAARDNLKFKILEDRFPIKNLYKYIDFKIEEIYFTDKLFIKHKKEFYKMKEYMIVYNNNIEEIIKKIKKYKDLNYSFVLKNIDNGFNYSYISTNINVFGHIKNNILYICA